jgi:hypothetical protein
MGARLIVWSLLIVAVVPAVAEAYDDATNPMAPTVNQVQGRFGVISQEISRRQQIGDSAGAAAMQAQLQHFQNQLAGTEPSSETGPELDLAGIYQSFGAYYGNAYVHLQTTDRPIVLAIGGYEPTNWTLQIDPGVQLQKVIVSNPNQQLSNLPPGIPVVNANYHDLWFGDVKDWQYFPRAAQSLYWMTGLGVASVQGQYDYAGPAFQIGPSNADWRAQRVLRDMNGLYKQATEYQRGQAANFVSGMEFIGFSRSDGAIARMSPLKVKQLLSTDISASLKHIAVDPAGPNYYGLSGDQLVHVDPASGSVTNIPQPAEIEWASGLTFDTMRNRVIVGTLSGEGGLYAYSPETQTWAAPVSLNHVDIKALTYSAAEDCLYAIRMSWSDRWVFGAELLKLSMTGQLLASIELSQPLPPLSNLDSVQLHVTGEYLTVLTSHAFDLYTPELGSYPRSFVIYPSSGDVMYYDSFPVLPEPAAGAVMMILMAAGLRRRAR